MPWANYTTHRLTGITLCANTRNYSLKHEERRRQNKSYNVVGGLFIPNFTIGWQEVINHTIAL